MGCGSSVHAVPPSAGSEAAPGDKPQPVTPDSRLLRGQAYYASGRVAEALKEYNATIAAWPTYARAYLERGNLRMEQEDFSLAAGDYTMALQLQSNLLQAYVRRCHARMALRQFAEALQDARAADKLDPENAQVRALKAQVRKAMAGGVASPTSQGGACGGGEEEDPFAGMETPKSTPSPSIRKQCMVCMDAERECRLRPCMHAALCVECAEGLMLRGYGCPICSSKIEQVERGTFMRTFTVEEAQGIVATAHIIAAMPSPGKSPMGRRFPAGAAGAPSLDGIVEVDEEAHSPPDAAPPGAAAASAAAVGAPQPARSVSTARELTGSSDGGLSAPPPVELDPHPITTRAQKASSRRRSAEQEAPAAEASEVLEEPGAAAAARPGGTAGGDGEVTSPGTASSPGGISGGTSTQLANSLADWIDLPTGGEATAAERLEGGRKASPAAAARPAAAATAAAATAAAAGSAGATAGAPASSGPSQPRLADTFSGFSASQQGRLGAAAPQSGPGPVAEACGSRGGVSAMAAVPYVDVGVSSESVSCVVGRVFFHGEPPRSRGQGQGQGHGQGAAPLPQQPSGTEGPEHSTSTSGQQDEDSNQNDEALPVVVMRQEACRSLAVRVRMGIPMGRHRYAASGAAAAVGGGGGGGSSSGCAEDQEDADGGSGGSGIADGGVCVTRSSNDAGGGARSSRCLHVGAGAGAGASGMPALVGVHSSSSSGAGGVEGARASGVRALSAGSSGGVSSALSDGRRSSGSGRLGLDGGGIISGTGAPDGWVGRAPGPICSSSRSPPRMVDPRSLRAGGSSGGSAGGGGGGATIATSTAAIASGGGGGGSSSSVVRSDGLALR